MIKLDKSVQRAAERLKELREQEHWTEYQQLRQQMVKDLYPVLDFIIQTDLLDVRICDSFSEMMCADNPEMESAELEWTLGEYVNCQGLPALLISTYLNPEETPQS